MEPNNSLTSSYIKFRSRWRNSINQLSKLEQESQLSKLDTVCRRSSSLKLTMKNRLGQIDDNFFPVFYKKKFASTELFKTQVNRIISTNHDTNVFTLGSEGTNIRLQESLIISAQEPNLEQFSKKIIYKCHEIREEMIEELTEYNNSKYSNQMKMYCTKYNQSLKSAIYSIINHPKRQLYEFCYMCDEMMNVNDKKVNQTHKCHKPLTSISSVQQALMRIQKQVKNQNNRIFDVFLHNALQPQVNIEQLVSNVTVLKQSIQHQYQPEEAVVRLRLMNLIGKKIGLLIEEQQLQNRLKNIFNSKE